MPANDQSPPVFIDQMPDYQKAVKDIRVLLKDPQAFQAAVDELKLGKEWQENKAALDALREQAGALMGSQSNAIENHAREAGRHASLGNAVAVTGGLAAGIVGGRRWGVVKGVLTGIAAAVVAKFIYSSVRPGPVLAEDKTLAAIEEQKKQLAAKALEVQQPFIDAMATRMLEEQKEFQGTGADMKLVSNAETTQTTSMAEKYATPPAVSNAAMLQRQKDAIVGAAR